jgi:sensor histidine kinase regulating citrate/malate metabolism
VPSSLFNSAAENFLQNALAKRGVDGALRIHAEIGVAAGRVQLRVTDNGAAVPPLLASEIGHGPVASENGLGIGLYQVAHYAEMLRYGLRLATNQPGYVSFVLEPAEQRADHV